MIFQRAVRREFTQAALGVFIALFAILLTTQLIRLLGQAAAGQVASEAVVALLGVFFLPFIKFLGIEEGIKKEAPKSWLDFSRGSARADPCSHSDQNAARTLRFGTRPTA